MAHESSVPNTNGYGEAAKNRPGQNTDSLISEQRRPERGIDRRLYRKGEDPPRASGVTAIRLLYKGSPTESCARQNPSHCGPQEISPGSSMSRGISRNCCKCFEQRGRFVVRSGGRGPWSPRLGTRLGGGRSLPSKSNNFRSIVLRLCAGGPGHCRFELELQ
jgi:hypothetical protein